MAEQKSGLTAGEVCSILVAASKSKVAALKFGDLHVCFEPSAGAIVPRGTPDGKVLGPKPTPATEIAETQKTEESRAILQDEVLTREQQLMQMTIENPVGLEQMLTEGDLLTDDDEDADEGP